MPKTYETLFPLVITEIEKRLGATVTSIGSRFSVQPGGEGGSIDARATSEMIAAIVSDISDIIEPRIISGLDVTATTPPSSTINIALGVATSHGKKWEISADTTTIIPLDASTYVFFMTIYNNTIEISRTYDVTKCELCKIIVPKPGTTSAIVDDKPSDGYDAYIVSAKDIVYKETQQFDDASIEKLRDVIGDILADNLIGNIKLSENLKITNTQGSLELDSASVKIKDSDANVLAKFDRKGTFFYDIDGRALAKFGVDEAFLGNILIRKNAIETRNFLSGSLGFQIKDSGDVEFNDAILRGTLYATAGEIGGMTITGTSIESSDFVSGSLGSGFRLKSDIAEFQNIKVRGKLSTVVFEKEAISSIGGNFMVIDSDILNADMTSSSTSLTISGDTTFSANDILRMKDDIEDEWLQVTDASSAPTYTVTRDKAADYSANNYPAWKKGTAVVNYGISGEGAILMTSSEVNSPYINFFTHSGSPWSSIANKTRLGNLNEIPGCSGYGIWGGSGFLGNLQVIDIINIGTSGAIRSNISGSYPYLEFSQSGLQLKDSDTGGTYSTGLYGTAKYGYGALGWIMNATIGIPWVELKEPTKSGSTMASIRLYNRSANPTGTAEVGDLAVVNGKFVICTSAGTPGTWTIVGTQT